MSSRLLLKTGFFALFATAVPASAQVSYRYTKIADTRGELREVANVGINNRGDVVFLGSFDAGGRVVFTGNEERLQVVADTRAGQFEDLVEEATINDRGAVAFASRGASPAVWKPETREGRVRGLAENGSSISYFRRFTAHWVQSSPRV